MLLFIYIYISNLRQLLKQHLTTNITGCFGLKWFEKAETKARSMRQAQKIYSSKVIKYVTNLDIPPDPPKKEWVPKHPDIKFNLKKEVDLSDEEWRESSFPYRDLPVKVTLKWKEKFKNLSDIDQKRQFARHRP